jgi:hypothetical protein
VGNLAAQTSNLGGSKIFGPTNLSCDLPPGSSVAKRRRKAQVTGNNLLSIAPAPNAILEALYTALVQPRIGGLIVQSDLPFTNQGMSLSA